MYRLLTLSCCLCLALQLGAQPVDPKNITIVRDQWGVPHIYGISDADAAYGLAWAHAEDAFELIQQNLLVGQGKLGRVTGTKGVLLDFALKFLGVDTLVDARYTTDLSPEYRKVLEGYIQGINDYAAKHPEEVLVKKSLPFTPQDAIRSIVTMTTLMAGAGLDIKAIRDDILQEAYAPNETGSNAMAISPSRTEDGKAWLLVNSHQPIEGPLAWYEAHINSEQGWNILGGLFPGGCSIYVGCNENLGWAHTTDYHNFGEIYQLQLSKNKKQYYYDSAWHDFSYKTVRLKVKLGFIRLPVKKKVPVTVFGPVFKSDQGWYALRYPGAMDIRAGEQWYQMNKAKDLAEFETAVKMNALPLFNIVYADRAGNIFMVSDGKIPNRDPSLNWSRPVLGTSTKYLWQPGQLVPYEKKVKYHNPDCGFVFNCNGTPLNATCILENKKEYFIGLQLFDYNRNERFGRLLNALPGKITWADFLRVKYDKAYDPAGSYVRNFKTMYNLDASKYPKLADAISQLKAWGLSGESTDSLAALAMLTNKFLAKGSKFPYAFLMIKEEPLSETEVVTALTEARHYLLKRFGKLNVPLGEVQRLTRGDISLPIGGLSEVPRACDVKYDKKKKYYKMTSGDGYYQLLKFSPAGVEIESISPFGASTHPDSPHYTDQMELFASEKTKTMTLDKATVFRNAKRVYHPGE